MELKSFKTYLNEQEQLDEFLGAAIGAIPAAYTAARAALLGSRVARGVGAAGTRLNQIGAGVRGRATNLLGTIRRNPKNAINMGLGVAQTAASLRGGGSIPQEPGVDGLPVSAPQTEVQLRSSTMQAPQQPQLNPRIPVDTSIYSFGGRNNTTLANLMAGRVVGAQR